MTDGGSALSVVDGVSTRPRADPIDYVESEDPFGLAIWRDRIDPQTTVT